MKSHIFTAVIGAVAAAGALFLAVPEAAADEVWVLMPTCQHEDGNPDGKPCLWISDTGVGYVNDGHNYRD